MLVRVIQVINKAKYLHPHKLLVTIQLDEIHIQPRTSYQCGKLTGGASNCEQKPANRIQAFMLSSVLSNNKDVMSLIPVQKMQTEHLFLMTKEVIRNVTLAGYRIVFILSDNNVVNRKMFMKLFSFSLLKHIAAQELKLKHIGIQ